MLLSSKSLIFPPFDENGPLLTTAALNAIHAMVRLLTAQPHLGGRLHRIVLVTHKALVRSAILLADGRDLHVLLAQQPDAGAGAQRLAVLQPPDGGAREAGHGAHLQSELEPEYNSVMDSQRHLNHAIIVDSM